MKIVFHHLLNLVGRAWHHFLTILGTTAIGFLVPAIISILIVGTTFFVIFRRQGQQAALTHWRDNVLETVKVAVPIMVIVYIAIFAWSLVRTIYDDHQWLMSENSRLLAEIQRIKSVSAKKDQAIDGASSAPMSPRIVVAQSVLDDLRRLGAEASMIESKFVGAADKSSALKEHAVWMLKTTEMLDSVVPSYGLRFKNAHGNPRIGCPWLNGGRAEDCVSWQDMVVKRMELGAIISEMQSN